MAAGVVCKRAVQLGTNSESCFTKIRGFKGSNRATAVDSVSLDSGLIRLSATMASSPQFNRFDCRQISQLVQSNGKRAFLVDTLALVINLELCCTCCILR